MYEHRNPTIGRDMTTPGSIGKKTSKPVEVQKPVCEQPVEKPVCEQPVEKPVCKEPVEKPVKDKKPMEDKKPVKEEKKVPKEDQKRIDPWSRLLFGPPRSAQPVQDQPTDDKKAEKPPVFSWI